MDSFPHQSLLRNLGCYNKTSIVPHVQSGFYVVLLKTFQSNGPHRTELFGNPELRNDWDRNRIQVFVLCAHADPWTDEEHVFHCFITISTEPGFCMLKKKENQLAGMRQAFGMDCFDLDLSKARRHSRSFLDPVSFGSTTRRQVEAELRLPSSHTN